MQTERIAFLPLKVEKNEESSLLYRLSIPFFSERLRRVLTGEVDPKEGMLEIESFLKELSEKTLFYDSFFADIDENGDLYVIINGNKSTNSKKLEIIYSLLEHVTLEKGKTVEIERLAFLPYELNISESLSLNFIEVLRNSEDHSPHYKIIPNYYENSILPYSDRIEFYDKRPIISIEVDTRNKKNAEDAIKTCLSLGDRLNISMCVKPLIINRKISIRGVFDGDLFSVKDRVREAKECIQEKFLERDGVSVFLGVVPILCGSFDFARFHLPIVQGYIPQFQESGVTIDDKVYDLISEKAFMPFNEVPFVGRLAEIEEITNILSNFKDEDLPYLLNVKGIPGVGKTRFVEEVLSYLRNNRNDIKVISLKLFYKTNRYVLLSIVADKLKLNESIKRGEKISKLHDIILKKLKELTKKHRLIIVIDNADYIDNNALSFMKRILTSKSSPPFFVILISRKRRVPDALSREKYSIIDIPPMARETIRFLSLEYLGYFPSNEMVDYIFSYSQGVPLYVMEILSRLKKEKKVVIKDGKAFLKNREIKVTSLEEMLGSYYKTLKGTPQKILLDIMAVFGNEITLNILKRVFSNISPNVDFETSIKSLVGTNLVEFGHFNFLSPAITITFKNSIFKEVILKNLAPNWRGRIRNLIIKSLLEDKHLPDIFKYGIIAEHFKEAGKYKEFCHYVYKQALEYQKVDEYDIAKSLLLGVLPYEKYLINKYEFFKTLTHVLVQTGDYKEARKYYEKMLSLNNDNYDILPLGIIIYSNVGEDEKAKELINRIDLRSIKGKRYKGLLYNALGIFYLRQHDLKSSVKYFEKARSLLKRGTDIYIANLLNTASALERMGKYYEALSMIDEAISISIGIEHTQQLMALHHNKAIIHIHLGEYEKAISSLAESAFWAEKMKLNRAMAYIYNTKGILYFEFGRYKDALTDLKKAYTYVLKTEDERQMASVLSNLGYTQTNLGFWYDAEKNLNESLKIRERIFDNRGISHTLFYLAELERQREQHEKSLEFFKKSISIKEELGDKMGMVYVLAYNGMLYKEMGLHDDAYKLIKRGIKMAEEVNDMHALLLLRLALSNIYIGLGEFIKASKEIGEVDSILSSRSYYHLEGFLHYLKAIILLREMKIRQAFGEFLIAREKFLFTGEKKLLAETVENLIHIMANHSVYYIGKDKIIDEAKDMLEFYRMNGLSHRAEKLSLNLSKL